MLLVFTQKQRGAVRIVTATPSARSLIGLTLADAQARAPDLIAVERDLPAEHRALERIADGCDRYTPMVAIDGDDGVTLDITGCGDERAIADAAVARLVAAGWHVRHAIARTPEAAQALARHQSVPAADEDSAVRRLPIAALDADEETLLALRRAGLKTIADLAARPSAPLAARFGAGLTDRLARLLGGSDSRIVPRRPPPALMFERRFAEPIARTDYAIERLGELVAEAEAALAERHQGARCYAARLYRSDGMARDLRIESSLPMRDPALVMRLFGERIDALADPIDPGFGFDMIRLAMPAVEPMPPSQLELEGGAVHQGELATLIDRLSTRVGKARFRRLHPLDSHVPEQAALALPAIEAPAPVRWGVPDAGEPPLRPLHLFDPPQVIEVIAEVPDGPPHRFRWRRILHEVTRFEGPERIAPEWWKRNDAHLPGGGGLTRDYYRVEDVRGRRFWIFRHGLYGTERADPGWYMHGLFA